LYLGEALALGVLRNRFAEMAADAPIDRLQGLPVVAVDRQAPNDGDAAPILHFLADVLELGAETRQRKIRASKAELRQVPITDRPRGRFQFGDIVRREPVQPGFVGGNVRIALGGRIRDRRFAFFFH
jgi:hypothetical protein